MYKLLFCVVLFTPTEELIMVQKFQELCMVSCGGKNVFIFLNLFVAETQRLPKPPVESVVGRNVGVKRKLLRLFVDQRKLGVSWPFLIQALTPGVMWLSNRGLEPTIQITATQTPTEKDTGRGRY